jgi:rhodanese-related sulfurtransferase
MYQVCDLLAGKYNDKIKRYHIIDCRFEYEYEGGHIENAIHVKEMGTLDELLLSASSGVHAGGNPLPQPSRSGELGDGEQVVLIFHCEFSAKRAPTLYVSFLDFGSSADDQCQTPSFKGSNHEQCFISQNLLPRGLHPRGRILRLLQRPTCMFSFGVCIIQADALVSLQPLWLYSYGRP